MLDLIKQLLNGDHGSRRLTDHPPESAVAVCALLMEAAEADHNVTDDERDLIHRELRRRFGLDETGVEALMVETQRQRAKAGDAWPFTHALSVQYSQEQKRDLLILIWQILLSDAKLTESEDQWVHRLQTMLAVNHSILIEAKLQARSLLGGAQAAAG
jgi:uncharacterized tellurite resistance protein B-like protein